MTSQHNYIILPFIPFTHEPEANVEDDIHVYFFHYDFSFTQIRTLWVVIADPDIFLIKHSHGQANSAAVYNTLIPFMIFSGTTEFTISIKSFFRHLQTGTVNPTRSSRHATLYYIEEHCHPWASHHKHSTSCCLALVTRLIAHSKTHETTILPGTLIATDVTDNGYIGIPSTDSPIVQAPSQGLAAHS